jgi:hypothetical protein
LERPDLAGGRRFQASETAKFADIDVRRGDDHVRNIKAAGRGEIKNPSVPKAWRALRKSSGKL